MGRPRAERRGEIPAPAIRIAELVRDGHLHAGEIVHAGVKIRHPSRTGLAFHDGKFVRE